MPRELEWIHDDWERAVADAKVHQRLILIDDWAHWCHTCINMKHTVLVDRELAPWFNAFTWLSVDTENPRNKALLERYPPLSWPTFFVIDPVKDVAIARLSGGANLEQFKGFLQEALEGAKDTARAQSDPLRLLAQGDQAMRAGDRLGARRAYAQALQRAGASWNRRADAQVLLLRTGQEPEDASWCQAQVETMLPSQGERPSSAEFFYFGRQCIKDPKTPKDQGLLQAMMDKMERILTEHGQSMSVDDKSTLLVEMREVSERLGFSQKARGHALVQQRLLDDAAHKASTAYEASMYNWPREEVYVYLGQGEDLVPELIESEEALPENYDPPYRLAWLYQKLGAQSLAMAAVKRALALVQGPRRARVLALQAEIEQMSDPQ